MFSHFADADVLARLECELNGQRVTVNVADRRIVVEVPNVAAGLAMLQLGSPRGFSPRVLGHWRQRLDDARHSLEIRIGGESIALLGYGVANSPWSPWALVGLPQMSIRPLRLARAWANFRRR